jgi:hypothetical protein
VGAREIRDACAIRARRGWGTCVRKAKVGVIMRYPSAGRSVAPIAIAMVAWRHGCALQSQPRDLGNGGDKA